jgi:hypothetical protein
VVPLRRAEQEPLAILEDAGGVDVGAQRLGEGMVARRDVVFVAFLCSRSSQPAPFGRRSATRTFSAAPMQANE